MKRRITVTAVLGLLLVSRWALGSPAVDPLGPFAVDPDPTDRQTFPALSLDAGDNLLVAWSTYGNNDGKLLVRRYDPAAEPLAGPLAVANGRSPLALTADRGGFTLLSVESFGLGIVFTQRLDRQGAATGDPVRIAMDLERLASDGGHRTLAVGTRYQVPAGVFSTLLDSGGRPVGKPLRIAESGGWPDVTMDARGRFVVIWTDSGGELGQRYSAAGEPLGGRFRMPGYVPVGTLPPPRIAGNADGRFVVAWPTEDRGLLVRLFGADGGARTPPLVVTDGPSLAYTLHLAVAMDASGAFLVTWDSVLDDGSQVRGRFYDPAGKPAGRSFRVVAPAFYSDSVDALTATAGATGRFAVAGQLTPISFRGTVFARRLEWAPAGDALCLYAAGNLACDLRRDGGAAEVSYAFGGGRPGDVPLLGDLDGDGRDEPCVYRAGAFLCDPARDGGAAELRIAFGAPGDVPLLGDVDGDGRDDPCVRRGDRFLCDTAHNGGTAEVVVTFGRAGDIPLLGDVNGDGASDPCVIEGRSLLWDTAHDGGTAETVLPFEVRPGDVPLLGDVDGDGLADPCVYRSGRLLCDTAHDGKLRFLLDFVGRPGAVPLLGNLEGL